MKLKDIDFRIVKKKNNNGNYKDKRGLITAK